MRRLFAVLLLCSCVNQPNETKEVATTTRTRMEVPAPTQAPTQMRRAPSREPEVDLLVALNEARRNRPCGEWLPTALAADWQIDQWRQMSYVMFRESRCRPDARSPSSDTGLMQINDFWCEPSKYNPNGWLQAQGIVQTCEDLHDPLTNLKAARAIFNYSLERNRNGWNPWSLPADFEP